MKQMLFALGLILLAGCAGVNEPPESRTAMDNLLAMRYFECHKCDSLDGGCYGKNSVSSYRTQVGTSCRHQWHEITPEEFGQKWTERSSMKTHY